MLRTVYPTPAGSPALMTTVNAARGEIDLHQCWGGGSNMMLCLYPVFRGGLQWPAHLLK
jgi:hypothetical protein